MAEMYADLLLCTDEISFYNSFKYFMLTAVLRVRDPRSGIWCFFTPRIRDPESGSGIKKVRDPDPG
jgi:hypothetical protein